MLNRLIHLFVGLLLLASSHHACALVCGVDGPVSTDQASNMVVNHGVGNIDWTGSVIVNYVCWFNATDSFTTSAHCAQTNGVPVGNMSGVQCWANGLTTTAITYSSQSGNPCTATNTTQSDGNNYYVAVIRSNVAQTCKFMVHYPIRIQQTAASISGSSYNFLAANQWGGAVPVYYPFLQTSTQTCTLTSASSMTVGLPVVALSALSAVNATAASTPFQVSVGNCSGAGFQAILWWNFTPYVTPSSVYNNLIANTYVPSGSAATNVGVRIVDQNNNVVANQSGSVLSTSVSTNTSYSKTFYAQYYAVATPVVPGGVTAVATFTLAYQ